MTYSTLEAILDYSFKSPELLAQALCHGSAASKTQKSYERLEFLGDRILGLAVAQLLYKAYPHDSEGQLAKRQSHLVAAETLAPLGQSWGLPSLILAENKDLAHNRPSILADIVEALLAVIYLESGFDAALRIVERFWAPLISEMTVAPQDPKSALQEWSHRHKATAPVYTLLHKTGPDHALEFTVQVTITLPNHPPVTTTGVGPSMRAAEKQGALALLSLLTSTPQPS